MDRKCLSILLVAMFSIIVFSSLGSAVNITDVSYPKEGWRGESLSFTYTCVNNTTAFGKQPLEISGEIIYSVGSNVINETNNSRSYKAVWSTEDSTPLGEYDVNITCSEKSDSASRTFLTQLSDLELADIEIPVIYSDEGSASINATLYKNNGTGRKKLKLINNKNWAVGNVKILSGSGNIEIGDVSFRPNERTHILSFNLDSLEKNKENKLEVNFTATYSGKLTSTPKSITTKDPVDFSIDQNEVEVTGDREVSLDISEAKYHGKSLNLNDDDLTLKLNEKKLSDWELNTDKDKITVQFPSETTGKYVLTVTANLNGISESEEIDVLYPITVSGSVVDAGGTPLSGRIVFKGQDERKTVNVSGGGTYTSNLRKGNYTVVLNGFKDLRKAEFYGVTLKKDVENLVSYDPFGTSLDLEGFKVAGGAAISFGKSYRAVNLEIKYDDTAYSGLNERKLRVMKCSNWNFGQRSCNGDWESLSGPEIHSMGSGGWVSFKVNSLSAFVIGQKEGVSLKSSLSPSRDKYYLNEDLNVQGTVTGSKGNSVKGVKVYYKLDSWTEKRKTETNEDGLFSFSFETPSEAGEYELEIFTKSSVYKDASQTHSLQVEKKKGISLVLPKSPKLQVGNPRTLLVRVRNSGQAVLKDIQVEVSGLNKHENITPQQIRKLNPGQERKVELNLVSQNVGSSRQIEVSVDSDKASKKGKFLILTKEKSEGEANKTTGEGGGFSLPSLTLPTGKIIAVPSGSLNFLLSLLVSGGVILVFFKKIRSKEREVRDNIITLGNNLREKVDTDSLIKEPSRSGEEFECEECGRNFQSKRALSIHKAKKHESE